MQMENIEYKRKLYNTNRKLYNINGKYWIQIENYTIQMETYTQYKFKIIQYKWTIIKYKWKRSNIATFDMPYFYAIFCFLRKDQMLISIFFLISTALYYYYKSNSFQLHFRLLHSFCVFFNRNYEEAHASVFHRKLRHCLAKIFNKRGGGSYPRKPSSGSVNEKQLLTWGVYAYISNNTRQSSLWYSSLI
jgi:hypothetical protein